MITIFTMPKPFRGHVGVIQRNAIQSWMRLKPECEIILMGNDDGTAETATEFGLRHIQGIANNEYGTPFVSDIFRKAQEEASKDYLCYINSDIILFENFARTILGAVKRKIQFLFIGRRWDLDITEPIVFNKNWQEDMKNLVYKKGEPHAITGLDYFAFRRGLWPHIPPLALGRWCWDNWLLFGALRRRAVVIDASERILIVHQNHHLSHIKTKEAGVPIKGPEFRMNLKLAGGLINTSYSLADATHMLTESGLRKVTLAEKIRRGWAKSTVKRMIFTLLRPVLFDTISKEADFITFFRRKEFRGS